MSASAPSSSPGGLGIGKIVDIVIGDLFWLAFITDWSIRTVSLRFRSTFRCNRGHLSIYQVRKDGTIRSMLTKVRGTTRTRVHDRKRFGVA
jgi:hypothetical protein